MSEEASQRADDITSVNVDLSNCDREQIQYSGAVQPHCVLLVLREPEFQIEQASANAERMLGLPAGTVAIETVLSEAEMETLRAVLETGPTDSPLHVLRLTRGGRDFHLFAHRVDGRLLLEFEHDPKPYQRPVYDLYAELRNALTGLQRAATLDEFFEGAVRRVREFTGFERVLAYQFLPDKSGKVVAEAKQEDAEAYLGLHYPAADIPAPARRLFSMLWLRHLPDVDYAPCPILPAGEQTSPNPLDLSLVAGRSVSVMYTKYLKNMGVRSTMVLTLMRDGKLWGLISCMNHSAPRHIPYDVRAACEFLGHMVSSLLATKEEEVQREKVAALHAKSARLLEMLSQYMPFEQGLRENPAAAADLLECGGAAIVIGNDISLFRGCPESAQVRQIAGWLETAMGNTNFFATDQLSSHMRDAERWRKTASGLLAIRLSRSPRKMVLWFRPEAAETVTWAGNPAKAVEVELVDGEARLQPRSSFAAWKETQQGKAREWAPYELKILGQLQHTATELIVRRTEELERVNQQLRTSNAELDTFTHVVGHDLTEPLRDIHNFSSLVIRTSGAGLDDDNRRRLQTIKRLTQRMDELIETLLHYSKVGRTDLVYTPTDLNEILDEVKEMLAGPLEETGTEIRVRRRLPSVVCDPIRIREVFVNLISNALKFNDKPEKWLEVGWVEVDPPLFWVRDNGIGIEPEQQEDIFQIFRRLHGRDEMGGGSGAGLTIVRRIVECHGGKIWVESTPGLGATFVFTLPGNRQVTESGK